MRKYLSLLLFVALISIISCENKSAEMAGDQSKEASNVDFAEMEADDIGSYEPDEARSTYNTPREKVSLAVANNGVAAFAQDQVTSEGYSSGSADEGQQPVRKTNDKIIRTGNLGIELEDYHKNKHQVYDAIRKYDGYISKENEQNETSRISNEIEVRVPNKNFDELMSEFTKGQGIVNVDYKRISAVDVGEEYYDLQTRIKTKKEVEQRYIEILRSAKKITDILAVEDQIRVIREEIESKEGRLRFLADRVSHSTIHLYMYQELEYNAPASKSPTFWGKVVNAAQTGWNAILGFLLLLVHIWPIIILLIVVLILYKRRLFIFKRGKSQRKG